MENLHFGIIGLGKISHRFVKGFQCVQHAKLMAVASRDIEKSRSYAQNYQIPCAYGSYLELCEDETIDVVYIATPNHLHYEHIMMCLQHGKHVMCEKPFVSTLKQAEEIFEFAKKQQRFVMEAQKALFIPTTIQVKKWIDEKKIGEMKYLEASYCYDHEFEPDHFINQKHGGAFMDVGVYPFSYIHYLIQKPITSIKSHASINTYYVDHFNQMIIHYEGDIFANITSATKLKTINMARIYGTKGYIEVENFWKSHDAILYMNDHEIERAHFDFESEFTFQIQHVINCIRNGNIISDVMSMDMSLDVMRIAEGLHEDWGM